MTIRRSAANDAARIAEHLDAIRDALRRSAWAEARQHPVPLTPAQLAALQLLVDRLRAGEEGPSLSTLSGQMGLAHSTVSGIVTRLEQRGLLRRTTDQADRRATRIELADPVKHWVKKDLIRSRLRPLIAALQHATSAERAAILSGLDTLHQLIDDAEGESV